MRIFPGALNGKVTAPPSKSHSHRAVFLASMADGHSRIFAPLLSADTLASCDAMRAMGATVDVMDDGSLSIHGGDLHGAGGKVDVGNSGTTLRLLAGLSSLFPIKTVIDGDSSLRTRPMEHLLRSLEELGAVCASTEGRPPVTVSGPLTATSTTIEGGVSSQFISSLLLAGGMRGERTSIAIEGRLSSKPYIDITISMMERFDAEVSIGERSYMTEGGGYTPCDYRIPGDFSSAAFPLVAGALCGDVTVSGLDLEDLQGDKAIIDVLRDFDVEVDIGDGWARTRRSRLRAAEVDMGDTPDLFPIIAVLAAYSEGESRLFNAGHLRFKESDRIATSVEMLRALGADIEPTADGCIVRGGKGLKGGRIHTHGDHRIMMAGAVAALNADGASEMMIKGEHSVSYPGFLDHLRNMGAVLELEDDERVWE